MKLSDKRWRLLGRVAAVAVMTTAGGVAWAATTADATPSPSTSPSAIATQRGEVTAVSQDSITVKSEDGYSRTYTVAAETLVNSARDGISSIKTGNTVTVTAVVADNTATATSISNGTAREAAGQKWGFKHGPR